MCFDLDDEPDRNRRTNRRPGQRHNDKSQTSQSSKHKLSHSGNRPHPEYVNVVNNEEGADQATLNGGGAQIQNHVQERHDSNLTQHRYPSVESSQRFYPPVEYSKPNFAPSDPQYFPGDNHVNEYNPNQTYQVGEDGPSKEELRYAQELLYQKYETKRKAGISNQPLTVNTAYQMNNFQPRSNLGGQSMPNDEYFLPTNDRTHLYLQESINIYDRSDSDLFLQSEHGDTKKPMPKQLFPDCHDSSVNNQLGVAPLAVPTPNDDKPRTRDLAQSLPSPEYHHLQHHVDDNYQNNNTAMAQSQDWQQNGTGLRNCNEDLQRFYQASGDMVFAADQSQEYYGAENADRHQTFHHSCIKYDPSTISEDYQGQVPEVSTAAVSKTTNAYENVDSSNNATTIVDAKTDFQVEYKSQFGQETAGLVKKGNRNDELPELLAAADYGGSNDILRYSDTMMYRLAHDSTLHNENMPLKLKSSMEKSNGRHSMVKGLLDEDISPKNKIPLPEVYSKKTNISVKELRDTIKKVKEAPPANIVQQRIKHFEDNSQDDPPQDDKIDQGPKDPASEKTSPRRRFYSDSEAVLYANSSSESGASDIEADAVRNGKSKDLTMQPAISEVTTVLDRQEPLYISMGDAGNLEQMKNHYMSNEATGRYNDFSFQNTQPILRSVESQQNISSLSSLQQFPLELQGPDSIYMDKGLDNANISQSSYNKYAMELKPPRHFRDSSQYSETDSRMSADSTVKLNEKQVTEAPPSKNPLKNVKFNELNPGTSVSNEANLPDLLKHEEGEESVISEVRNHEKSNSSDADDEASKDFDSIPVKKPFQTKLNFWCNKDKAENNGEDDTDSEKDSIPSYPPPPPPPVSTSSGLKDYYEQQLSTDAANKKSSEPEFSSFSGHSGPERWACKEQVVKDEGLPPQASSVSSYSQYRLYEDDRRTTQFLVKPVSGSEDNKPKLLVKKIRIYDEGRAADNMKNYPADAIAVSLGNAGCCQNAALGDDNDAGESADDGAGHYVGLRAPESIPVASGDSSCTNSPADKDRSPNSAPYYYSDLLKDDGHILDDNSQSSPRLSARPVPNNVRSVSPPNLVQADIGRRVNLIHQQEAEHLNAEVENNLRYPSRNPSEITPEIRCSLEQILGSESKKFSDLERNRYEAGNTLEKTRHLDNNRIKLRSATPDFDLSTNRHVLNDDVHRPMALQNHNLLSRRMSRSMEDLLDGNIASSSPMVIQDVRRHVVTKLPPPIPPPKPIRSREPYYENSAHLKRMSNLEISQEEHDSILARRGLPIAGYHEARPQAYPAKHSVSSDDLIGNPTSHRIPFNESHAQHHRAKSGMPHFNPADDAVHLDAARDFHNQQVRNVNSNQSFLEFRQPNPDTGPDLQARIGREYVFPNHFLGVGQKADFKGGGAESSDNLIEAEVAIITSAPNLSSTQSSCSSLDGGEALSRFLILHN